MRTYIKLLYMDICDIKCKDCGNEYDIEEEVVIKYWELPVINTKCPHCKSYNRLELSLNIDLKEDE